MEEFIEEICEDLEIKKLPVVVDKTKLLTDTMLAATDGKNIYLANKDTKDPSVFFAIAHELRHLWQKKYDFNYYFSHYKQASDCISIIEYNNQIAELDANAYAIAIIFDIYGVLITLENFDPKTRQKIYNMAQFILDGYYENAPNLYAVYEKIYQNNKK